MRKIVVVKGAYHHREYSLDHGFFPSIGRVFHVNQVVFDLGCV